MTPSSSTTTTTTSPDDPVVVEELLERVRSAEVRAEHLERALVSSRRIGMAVGVLMCRHRLTCDQGVAFLKRISQDHNIKLRDLADSILDGDTGEQTLGRSPGRR